MGLITTVRASRPAQVAIGFILFFLMYWFIFPSGDSYSPEELNSLLQNKDESVVSIRKVELNAQRLAQPYFDLPNYRMSRWELKGSPVVHNNDFVRLTSDQQHQVANMFSTLPIQAESFEMEMTFHLHSNNANGLVGDGFGIWFIDKKSNIGDVFGVENHFNGLGIMVDTYKNGKRGHFPYVNLMLGDGQKMYNKETDGFEHRLAGCTARSLLNPGKKVSKARIVYIKDGYLSLDFDYTGSGNDWTNCVTLSDVRLPQIKYLGFSGETGDLSETIDIIENRIFALYKHEGDYIESISELETLMKEQSEAEEVPKNGRSGGRNRAFKKSSKSSSRKSLQRLKNAEKRIKEKERQKRKELYGDEDATLFRRLVSQVLYILKLSIYLVVFIAIVWLAIIMLRVRKQRNRSRKTSLLD